MWVSHTTENNKYPLFCGIPHHENIFTIDFVVRHTSACGNRYPQKIINLYFSICPQMHTHLLFGYVYCTQSHLKNLFLQVF